MNSYQATVLIDRLYFAAAFQQPPSPSRTIWIAFFITRLSNIPILRSSFFLGISSSTKEESANRFTCVVHATVYQVSGVSLCTYLVFFLKFFISRTQIIQFDWLIRQITYIKNMIFSNYYDENDVQEWNWMIKTKEFIFRHQFL